tara:strand:- start:67 stop:408 length:342 start_codon:yes stop_codon:yes gene_type:complete
MSKIDELNPDFIKEFLKTKDIDLDKMMSEMEIAPSAQTRLKIMKVSLDILAANKAYTEIIMSAGREFSTSILEACALLQDVYADLCDGKEHENAVKVKEALMKLDDELKEQKD